jgi:hypothetical protein
MDPTDEISDQTQLSVMLYEPWPLAMVVELPETLPIELLAQKGAP